MTTQNDFISQLKLFFDQVTDVLSFDRAEIEKAKERNDFDLFLLSFLIIYAFSISIIEIDLLRINIYKWGFIVFGYPILWFLMNWIFLRVEDLFRSKESYSSNLMETGRLFTYTLIPYLIIYFVNYSVFLFTYDFNYYIFNHLLLLILNVVFLKYGFKRKEFITCVINGMFSVGIPYFGFIYL